MTIFYRKYSSVLFFIIIFFFLFFAKDILAKNCHKEDFVNFVSDAVGCIAINIHQEEELLNNIYKKNKLVFLFTAIK